MFVVVRLSVLSLTLRKLSRDPFSMYSVTIMTGLPVTEEEGLNLQAHCTRTITSVRCPAKQQTLTLQHPIDFRFILSGSEQGGP